MPLSLLLRQAAVRLAADQETGRLAGDKAPRRRLAGDKATSRRLVGDSQQTRRRSGNLEPRRAAEVLVVNLLCKPQRLLKISLQGDGHRVADRCQGEPAHVVRDGIAASDPC